MNRCPAVDPRSGRGCSGEAGHDGDHGTIDQHTGRILARWSTNPATKPARKR